MSYGLCLYLKGFIKLFAVTIKYDILLLIMTANP